MSRAEVPQMPEDSIDGLGVNLLGHAHEWSLRLRPFNGRISGYSVTIIA